MRRFDDRLAALERRAGERARHTTALVRVADVKQPTIAHLCAALSEVRALLDAGVLYVRPFDPTHDLRQYDRQITHMCWVRGAESGLYGDDPRWQPLAWLQWALDSQQAQHGSAFCQSSAEAQIVISAVLDALHALVEEPL